MPTWRYRCLIKSSISKRTVFFFLVCRVNILHGMLCFPYSDHLMFSGPVYMRWASPVSRASPLNRDGSAFRCVYMIGVVWWWHLFARKYAISKLLLTEMILSISSLGWPLIMLALITISVHSWKTMRYGQEILKLFSCSKTKNWTPVQIRTQNLVGSGSLSSKLQRDSYAAEQGHLLNFF